MSEDKNNLPDSPEEMPAVGTTIVEGRPPGSGKPVGNIPRGIEVLVKKAAIDGKFREQLIQTRSNAADVINLSLTPAEKAMLDGIPEAQLIAIINNTKVQPGLVNAFMTYTAAIMLAALGCTTPINKATSNDPNLDGGARPDLVEKHNNPSSDYWVDQNRGIKVKAGVLTGTITSTYGDRMRGTVVINGKAYDENLRQEVSINTTVNSDSDGFFRMDPAPSGSFVISAHSVQCISEGSSTIIIPIDGMASVALVVSPMAHSQGHRPDIPKPAVGGGSRPQIPSDERQD